MFPRQLYEKIRVARPPCTRGGLETNPWIAPKSPSWLMAMYLCQDCPVIQQCRDLADIIENNITEIEWISCVYGGEAPYGRTVRRRKNRTLKGPDDLHAEDPGPESGSERAGQEAERRT